MCLSLCLSITAVHREGSNTEGCNVAGVSLKEMLHVNLFVFEAYNVFTSLVYVGSSLRHVFFFVILGVTQLSLILTLATYLQAFKGVSAIYLSFCNC